MTPEETAIALEAQRALGRFEGKIDALFMLLQEHIKKDEQAWERVTKLEKKLYLAAGAVSVITFFLTATLSSVLKKIGLI